MVDSLSAVLLQDSVTAIRDAFEASIVSGNGPSGTHDYGVPQLFETAFADEHETAKIPLLLSTAPVHGRLVRCICYVTHSDSEIFGGAYREQGVWHFGRYGLDAHTSVGASEGNIIFEERTSLRCRVIDLPNDEDIEVPLQQLSMDDTVSSATASVGRDVCVKLYNEREEGLLHACLDIVGVLEVCEEGNGGPVLHSLITKSQRLSSLIASGSDDDDEDDAGASAYAASEVRADVLRKLEEALEGDSLAAELCLISLVASVSLRSPLLVGPFTLNVREVSGDTAVAACKLISELTSTLEIEMSIASLNQAKLYPSHDGEDFSTGSLQLPTDYAVVVNEAGMSEGQLNERGVKNLHNLTHAIDAQELIFYFPFNEFKTPIDLSFIVLSQTKSLLPNTVSIPLRRSSSWNLQASSSKDLMRRYLARCRLQEVEIQEAVSHEVQEDFVRSRKQGEAIDQAEFSMALAIGKETAKTRGRRYMTWEDYEHARKLLKRVASREHLTSQTSMTL